MASPGTRILYADRLESTIGTLLLIHDRDGHVRALDFHDFESRMRRLLRLHYGAEGNDFAVEDRAAPTTIRRAISDYFSGDLCAVNSIPVTTGGTSFQREVWAALRTIEAGTTLSYGALARQLGRPKSVRAVGSANGANPVAIVVPCHRVIGADGSLTGYGGGISRKRWLLTHEGVALEHQPTRPRYSRPPTRLSASPVRDTGLAVLDQLAPGQLAQADIEHRRQEQAE